MSRFYQNYCDRHRMEYPAFLAAEVRLRNNIRHMRIYAGMKGTEPFRKVLNVVRDINRTQRYTPF